MSVYEDLIKIGIKESTKLGASYVAVKISDLNRIEYGVQNGITNMKIEEYPGAHVRVIANGSWGFAGSTGMKSEDIRKLAYRAVKLAKANAAIRNQPVKIHFR